ncbi:hypothetical protein [Heyndrickxia camelliae]|uniref:hypothetical protein n=1 Tax=Heyndrickxia camelliae TaxID=1707093 RepID=UPI0013FD5E80|nr:hypothetical protein [Heyndrickxia camelliae]
MTKTKTKGIDASIVYDYKEFPDAQGGVCDNCGTKHFQSTVKDYKFIRVCRNCGLTKSI